jgi:transcriptional regulator with XRE-family HTH domain
MEFHEKLQELRKQKGLTQEELAAQLYVSRAAVSKWESGRGYPSIDSLREMAKFFSVTVDALLSSDELLSIAETEGKQKEKHLRDLVFGLLDICMALLFFLPFFAESAGETVKAVSLLSLGGIQQYLQILYITLVACAVLFGILTLALQNWQAAAWVKSKATISLVLTMAAVLLFIVSRQPYAAVFALCLLVIKSLLPVKRV